MRYKELKKKIKKLKETKYNKTYDFRKFNTIHVFGNDVNNNFINMSMANDAQNHLTKQIRKFKNMTRTQDPNLEKVKEDALNSAMELLK